MAASIQPMGDFTQTGNTTTNSGNPSYGDASAGPSSKTPNASPHLMQKKRKKAEALDFIMKKLIEGKVFDYSEAGYVETPVSKQCGTCEYFQHPNICLLPMNGPVDASKGCCNFWEAKDLNSKDTTPADMSEKKEKYCRGCSVRAGEDTITCSKCGSMEFTEKPMSKFTYGG